MLRIRLQRIGRRNQAAFRIVVAENTRAPKSGDYVERVGSWNPRSDEVILLKDRILHWLSVGAQPTDTVYNLLVKNGVIEGKAKNVLPKKTPLKKETDESEEAAADSEEATSSEEAAPAEETEEKEAAEEAPAEEKSEEAQG